MKEEEKANRIGEHTRMRKKDKSRKHSKKEKAKRRNTQGEQKEKKPKTNNTTQGETNGHPLNKSKHIRESQNHT